MRKIISIIYFATCTFMSCTNSREYLPEAPFSALKGEIDSVRITYYLAEDNEVSDVIQTTSLYAFDKNGYKIKEVQSIYNIYPNEAIAEVTTVTNRDNNSLPISQIVNQIHRGGRMQITFGMNNRENNQESYIVKDIKSDDTTEIDQKELLGQEWIVKKFSKLVINTIMTFDGIESTTTEEFDEAGKLISKTVEVSNEDQYDELGIDYENELTYDENGLLTKSITTRENEMETIIEFFKDYEFEENFPHNWVSRNVLDEDGKLIRVEKQKIYYRKK